MRTKRVKTPLALSLIILTMGAALGSALSGENLDNQKASSIIETTDRTIATTGGITNLSMEETWEYIRDPSNGIQRLIDVRTTEEYFTERILSPSLKERAILFPLQWLQRENLLLNIFMMLFDGQEIILYCRSANRSYIAGQLLLDHGFNGKIYNMMGGIKEWKQIGLPTISGLPKRDA